MGVDVVDIHYLAEAREMSYALILRWGNGSAGR